MNGNVVYEQPRDFRIDNLEFHRFSSALKKMGISRQEFRVVGDDGQGVGFVHPDDLSFPVQGPVKINLKLGKFIEES